MPLVTLEHAYLAFGHELLLAQATLPVERGGRLRGVGRNGADKSSLLQLISGEQAPDVGVVRMEPHLRTTRKETVRSIEREGTRHQIFSGAWKSIGR